MGNRIRDEIAFTAIVNPQNISASTNSASVQLTQARRVLAFVQVGALTGTGTDVTVRLQRSADGTNWSNITNKAVTLNANQQAAIELDAAELPDADSYVRYRIELGAGVTGAQVAGVLIVGDARYLPPQSANTVNFA
ncbi:MAG: hypothetical protein RML84_10875 [Anaerolineae bacterium]|nr:hypothetical protein [Anaerolineae bacterium]